MVGRMPVAFLHLDLPPEEVDVNVHPTKVEVRFRDGQRIYSQLLSTVRQTFLSERPALPAPGGRAPTRSGRANGIARRDPSKPAFTLAEKRPRTGRRSRPGSAVQRAGEFPVVSRAGLRRRAVLARTGSRTLPPRDLATPGRDLRRVRPLDPRGDRPDAVHTRVGRRICPERRAGAVPGAPGPPAPRRAAEGDPGPRQLPDRRDQRRHDGHRPACAPRADPVRGAAVDGSRRGGSSRSGCSCPSRCDLTAAEAAAVLEQGELLGQLGLEVEPFGGDTVLVLSVPAMLPSVPPDRLLRDLAEHLRTKPLPPTRDAPAGRPAPHGRLQGGDQGRPAAHPRRDRRPARTPPPGLRLPPLPARPADGPGLHQVRAGTAVRADLTAIAAGSTSGRALSDRVTSFSADQPSFATPIFTDRRTILAG